MKYCSRKSAAPEVQIFEAVAQLPGNWDDRLPDRHFLRKETLLIHEQTNLPDMRTMYAGISRDGQWVAQAAFQVLALKDKHLNERSVKPWQRTAWKLFKKCTSKAAG